MTPNFRFVWRIARKSPGSTAAAFVALALAIGGATAIFSAVSAVLLRPLPVKDEGSLVRLYTKDTGTGAEDDVSLADYLEWKRNLRSFAGITVFANSQATLAGGAAPERVVTVLAEANLLPLLGVTPLAGRNFLPAENEPGHTTEAILSWTFWQSHFGGQNVLGRKLILDEQPYTIVGVLPRRFTLLGHRDLLLPLTFNLSAPENQRTYRPYEVFGRLASGISMERANIELARLAATISASFPKENKGVSAKAVSLRDSIGGEGIGSGTSDFKPALLFLLAAVLCVLLIACGNVTNLNLARAWEQQREIAVRLAVGASRGQLIQQKLLESILLSLAAALGGLLLVFGVLRVLKRLSVATIPRLEEASLDWRVLLFALAIGILSGLASGLVPALRANDVELSDALKQASGRTTESRSHQRLRKVFVALQTGLAAVLLIECGLFVESFTRASKVDLGLAPDHLLSFYLALPASRYGVQHPEAAPPLIRATIERIRALPGVSSAAAADDLPLTGTAGGGGLRVRGGEQTGQAPNAPLVMESDVSPQYFHTLQTRFLAGTDFSDQNASSNVAIVNQALARRFFPRRDPLGQQVAYATDKVVWRQIIGVVADVPQTSVEKKADPQLFLPMTRLIAPWLAFVVRVHGDPLSYIGPIKAEVTKMDPAVAVFLPRTMDQILAKQLQWRSLQTWVVAAFAFLAITLASLGTYAVIAYSVSQRRNEIGLRVALGATSTNVQTMILWQGVQPVLIGVAAGLVCGFALARATAGLLFGTQPSDAAVYGMVGALLLLVSVAASFFPAIRAASMEPWKALRHE